MYSQTHEDGLATMNVIAIASDFTQWKEDTFQNVFEKFWEREGTVDKSSQWAKWSFVWRGGGGSSSWAWPIKSTWCSVWQGGPGPEPLKIHGAVCGGGGPGSDPLKIHGAVCGFPAAHLA